MYENTQNFRITSFFGDDEVLGSYVVRFFPFLIYLCFALDIKKKKYKIYFNIFYYFVFFFDCYCKW